MAKAPMAGLVKTRLAAELGVATAARFARHATATLVRRLGHHPAWHTTLAITPDACMCGRYWPLGIARVPQGRGNLGQRMQRILDFAPPGPIVIIGTDIPAIRVDHIREAFRLLGQHDAVFGPAADGGYWLVGLKRYPRVPKPFSKVRWSSSHALADTLDNMAGLSVANLSVLSDVDTADDFARNTSFGRRIASTIHTNVGDG